MKIRNVRGLTLQIAATGQHVEPGDVADVPAELGARLLEQPDNWATATTDKKPEGAGDQAPTARRARRTPTTTEETT